LALVGSQITNGSSLREPPFAFSLNGDLSFYGAAAISENGRAVLFEALIAVDGERFFSFDTVRNRGIEVL
jgi:hypothetical protein